MNTEQKVDLILKFISLHGDLFLVREEKNRSVRSQNFNEAITHREKEKQLDDAIRDVILEINKLLNQGENPERSVATEDKSELQKPETK